jgi:membrane protein DedA with SNARE-associated domain
MRWHRYLPAAFAGALVWAVVMTQLGRSAAALSGNLVVTVAVGMVATALLGAGVTLVLRRRTAGNTRRAVVSPICPVTVGRAEPGGPFDAPSRIAA